MMPSKFKVKSGKEITIRLATLEDASALLAMKLEYLENTTTIPLFQKEYPNDINYEVQLIQRLNLEKNSALLVAEYNGRLIGNIDLNGNQRLKLFHTGVIGMGIRDGWRGLGVGTALMKVILDWTTTNNFISLLWLEVYDSNVGGKILYEKLGFHECGRITNFFCESDKFIDKITMVRHL